MLVPRKKCVGCGLCSIVCPFGSIKMVKDQWGFFYPVIDSEKCKNCGICSNKCPQSKDNADALNSLKSGIECYVAVHKQTDVVLNSSSGGVISAIVEEFSKKKNSWLCAATFDSSFRVYHELIKLDKYNVNFRKSKYIQSCSFDCLKLIKEKLDLGENVLFVGTPCQVSALKDYVPNSNNLFVIDILCTGVGSPILLEKHINFLQRKRNKRIISYDMRAKQKRKDGTWDVMGCKIGYEDGTYEKNSIYKRMFKETFYKHFSLRPSCYSCRYKCKDRVGDITVGDWWKDISLIGIENKGASAVIINSERGRKIFNGIKNMIYFFPVEYDLIVEQQPALRQIEMEHKSIQAETDRQLLNFMMRNAIPEPIELIKIAIKAVLPKKLEDKIVKALRKECTRS